jgi:hypothetical protein
VLRDWRLAHMAPHEEVASSMGLSWLQASLRVVQCYEGDMGGMVYEREKMERKYTTLAVPEESISEQCDTVLCEVRDTPGSARLRSTRRNAMMCARRTWTLGKLQLPRLGAAPSPCAGSFAPPQGSTAAHTRQQHPLACNTLQPHVFHW